MPRFFVVWLITEIAVAQTPKKRSRCQHRKRAVARIACQKVGPNALSWMKGSGKKGPVGVDSIEDSKE